jgi:hypothetical protein
MACISSILWELDLQQQGKSVVAEILLTRIRLRVKQIGSGLHGFNLIDLRS